MGDTIRFCSQCRRPTFLDTGVCSACQRVLTPPKPKPVPPPNER